MNENHIPSQGPVVRGRRSRAWYLGGGAVVVVLAGLAGTAYAAQVFTPPKQVVLNAIGDTTAATHATSAQENWNVEVKNLHVQNLPPTVQSLVSSLDNTTIGLDLKLDTKQKAAEVDLSTDLESVHRQASLWLTGNEAVLSASGYQSLLGSFLPTSAQIPKYLVTDSSQSAAIQKFWATLAKAEQSSNPATTAAAKKLMQLVIEAIPGQYFHRQGLTVLSLSFDQQGLQDILKSEVRAVYANPGEYAALISQVESANLPAGQTQADVKQSIQSAITSTPEEAVMAAISTALGSGNVTVKQTTLTVHKGLFGQPTESLTGGVVVNVAQAGVSGELDYQMTAGPLSSPIQTPAPTAADSKTFTAFATALATGQ